MTRFIRSARFFGFLFCLSLALTVALPRPARAGAFSAVDGSVLGPDTQSWHVWLGLPTLGLRYLAGQPEAYDFGYGATFNYLRSSLDTTFGVRWKMMEKEEFNMAFTAEGGLHLNFGGRYADPTNAGNWGLRMTPGISLGMKPLPIYNTYFTLELPFLWTFRYGGGYRLPLLMGLGMEYMISPDMNLVAYGKVGPRFEGGGGYVGATTFAAEGWVGLSFRVF